MNQISENDGYMKILFIYKEDYPWDVRVEKIVKTLVAAGHSLTLLARNERRLPTREVVDGFTIKRLPAMPAWFGRLNTLFSLPLFLNPVWLHALWRALGQTEAEVVIVRDLPLMPAALLVARLCKRQVVFDMAECYPEMYRSILEFNPERKWIRVVKNPWFTTQLERISVSRADHTLVMIEESRDRLLRMGFSENKISIVSNTPPLVSLPPREHRAGNVLRLLYVGFVTRIRGLDNLLHGLHAYKGLGSGLPAIEFHVVGIGAALEEYRILSQRLGVTESVRFHGWCKQDFVDALYADSDIGVLTYRICGHWNHTIPNKLFDYMRSGMPVLATDIQPIRRIVEQENCGLIIPDGDPEACALALASLADPDFRATLGRNGNRAVLERYNWELDSTRLVRIIAGLRPKPAA